MRNGNFGNCGVSWLSCETIFIMFNVIDTFDLMPNNFHIEVYIVIIHKAKDGTMRCITPNKWKDRSEGCLYLANGKTTLKSTNS